VTAPSDGEEQTLSRDAGTIADVWYPRISSIRGPSDAPDSLDPVAHLPVDYLPFRRPDVAYPDGDGTFVLIVPVIAAEPAG
jgi:hypothetical protein